MSHLSPLLKQATSVVAVRGDGVYLYGADGRRYLDFTAGIGVTSTGHCHPKVVAATQRQVATIVHAQTTTVMHPWLLELSDRLAGKLPPGIDSLFFSNAGTEAVEAALRLARHATGRSNVVVFHGSFHGRTLGSAALTTSRTAYRAGFQPLPAGVTIAPFPYAYRFGWDEDTTVRFCLRELDHLLATVAAPQETAAMFIEPVLGEGGYVPTPPAFFAGLRERCDRHGILLVADEIQTGYGRTGRFWGHEHAAVRPDLLVTAKGLASGFPLSALAAPRQLMDKGWPGSQGGTYGGNAVSCAAALATLDVIEQEQLVQRAAELGPRLVEALGKLASDHPVIGDVRGLGLMVANEFTTPAGEPDAATAAAVQQEAMRSGLLLLTCGTYGNVIRWLPPLIVTEQELEEGLDIYAGALDKVTRR